MELQGPLGTFLVVRLKFGISDAGFETQRVYFESENVAFKRVIIIWTNFTKILIKFYQGCHRVEFGNHSRKCLVLRNYEFVMCS